MATTDTNRGQSGTGKAADRLFFHYCALYLFIFFGYGAFYPLLTQYYTSISLSGTEIGVISAITPVVSIVAQPLWGMICDRYQIRKPVLILVLAATGLIALLFTLVSSFAWVLVLFIVFSLFQSAIVPVSDSMALTYAKQRNTPFGNIRLWGAVGFALAAYVTGLGVEEWGPSAIFFIFCASLLTAVLFLRQVPGDGEQARFGVSILAGLKDLLKIPRYMLFMISAFFLFGSVNANNIWFALYYQHIGGTVAGIGLAFLLFAGSEAPAMKLATVFIRRWGLEYTILLGGLISAGRWLWYGTAPSTTWVIAMFFIQGFSVGFYLASASQYVRENTPASLQVTALAIFAAVGQGLGTMVCNLAAGLIADYAGILSVYWFFGIATLIGMIPMVLICFGPYRQKATQ